MLVNQRPICVMCNDATDQTCLWCSKPLHRHQGQDDTTGNIERTLCWMQHQFCIVNVKGGARHAYPSYARRQPVLLTPPHGYTGRNR